MEQALPEEVGRGREGVSAKGEGVEVGWEERAREPAPVGAVSVPSVGQEFPTKLRFLAIT